MRYLRVSLGLLLGLVLMVLSFLRVSHVVVIDYEAFEYGFPLPWLIYMVSTLAPVNKWVPNPVGTIADLVIWLIVGNIAVFLISRTLGKTLKNQTRTQKSSI